MLLSINFKGSLVSTVKRAMEEAFTADRIHETLKWPPLGHVLTF